MILWRGFLAAVVALAVLGPVTPVRAATPPDTLVMAMAIDDVVGFDPAEGYGMTEFEVISNCYDRVMRYEPEDLSKLVGEAVESWTVSDDGKTFTFKVRPGQKFHSGNPLTAEDIVFSLQRVVELNKAPSFLLTQLGWTADSVKHLVVATNDNSFTLTITKEFAPSLVLNILSSSVASIVDEKEVMAHAENGDLGYGWLKSHDAGSGAYIMRSWKPDDAVVMEANPDYRFGAPRIKRVILKHTPEPTTQRLLLERGDVDIARNLGSDQIAGLAGDQDVVLSEHPSGHAIFVALNQKDQWLSNPRVREAIRYLIDYQGMVDTFLKGQFIVHQAFWPSGLYASLDDNPYKLDVAKAKRLLSESGCPAGLELRMNTRSSSPFIEIAQSIQRSMADAGIKLDIVQSDQKQVATLFRARQHQVLLTAWGPDFPDPQSNAAAFAYNIDNSDSARLRTLAWRNSWNIPELSKETEAAARERDPDKRRLLYLDLQRKVEADSPFIVLFQATTQIAARKDVKGFVVGPSSDQVYYRLVSK